MSSFGGGAFRALGLLGSGDSYQPEGMIMDQAAALSPMPMMEHATAEVHFRSMLPFTMILPPKRFLLFLY